MASQPDSPLCCLPEELIIHLLSLCHPVALVTCRTACKLLLRLIDVTMLLQYQIELYADGMLDGHTSCPLALAQRLAILRSRRNAWKELTMVHRPTPAVLGSWSAYELVDGVFSKTLHLTANQSANGILFNILPSRDEPGTVITIDDVGFPFRDFAMDPTQDLVVYMQCTPHSLSDRNTTVTLYFRTMSDNKAHPRAQAPMVQVTLPTHVDGAVIQTVDEVCGFMSWDDSNIAQLTIWDWNQSTVLVAQNALPPLADFAFLSSRAYVLTSPVPEPCFRVYTFTLDDDRTEPRLRATLNLPPMHEGASASIFGIHTGPFTTTAKQPHGRPKPFVRDPLCRIHIINMVLEGIDDASHPCLIVIHNRTFLAHISNPKAVDVVWPHWGPENTHWIYGRTGSQWLRYVYGERLVRIFTPPDGPLEGSRQLQVYDFGAPRGPRSWLTPEENATIREPRELAFDTIFTERVVSGLPCRVMAKHGRFPYSGFMIDDERLIGLKSHWAAGQDYGSIDVFTF